MIVPFRPSLKSIYSHHALTEHNLSKRKTKRAPTRWWCKRFPPGLLHSHVHMLINANCLHFTKHVHDKADYTQWQTQTEEKAKQQNDDWKVLKCIYAAQPLHTPAQHVHADFCRVLPKEDSISAQLLAEVWGPKRAHTSATASECAWQKTEIPSGAACHAIDCTHVKVCSMFFGSDCFVLEKVVRECSGPPSSESPCILNCSKFIKFEALKNCGSH